MTSCWDGVNLQSHLALLMNWRYFGKIFIPILCLIASRYSAGTAVRAEAFIKTITDQNLPDSLSRFESSDLNALFDLLGDKGLERYLEFILYRLPSQALVLSIIYPVLSFLAHYLGNAEKRSDLMLNKKQSRYYPTLYLHKLTWPFLISDVLQTGLLVLSISMHQQQQMKIFLWTADLAGKMAIAKSLSLVLLLNIFPVGVLVSIARILIIRIKCGNLFGGLKDSTHDASKIAPNIRISKLKKEK